MEQEVYRILFEKAPYAAYVTKVDGTFLHVNQSMLDILGYNTEEIMKMNARDIYVDASDRTKFQEEISKTGSLKMHEVRLRKKDGSEIYCELTSALDELDGGNVYHGIVMDITERKEAERAIKTLTGLIPICASCKNIRDDTGYWNEVEKYIMEHTDAKFSHGICPGCMEKLYPDYVKKLSL